MLVPEQVKKEFNQSKIDEVEAEYLKFCDRLIKFGSHLGLPDSFKRKNIDDFRVDFQSRVDLIREIFEKYSTDVPTTNEAKQLAFSWVEEGKKPFGKYNGIGDSFIIASLYEFLDKRPLTDVFFISHNHTDFSAGNMGAEKLQVHPDLKDGFDQRTIKYNIDIQGVYHKLREEIGLRIEDVKEFGAAHQVPYKINLKDDGEDSFIQDTRTLESILDSATRPTYNQKETVLRLISSKKSYEDYFFRHVKSPVWYQLLKDNSFFNINIDPDLQTPTWFGYTDSLLSSGVEKTIGGELINLIQQVVADCNLNLHFIYRIIHLFGKIPLELINKNLVTITIPKILSIDHAHGNIQYQIVTGILKRLLLSQDKDHESLGVKLFQILIRKDVQQVRSSDTAGLSINEFGSAFTHEILSKLDSALLLQLARITANETQEVLNWPLERSLSQEFELDNGEKIGIEFKLNGDKLETITKYKTTFRTYEFERKSDERWKTMSITSGVQRAIKRDFQLELSNSGRTRFYLEILLEPDLNFIMRIEELGEHEVNEGQFAWVLRNILLALYSKDHSKDHRTLIQDLYFSGKYNAFLFRRLVLNTISEQFGGVLEELLTYLLVNNSSDLFQDQRMKEETWSILNKVGSRFTSGQKQDIKSILENDELVWSLYDYAEWKFFWLSALKGTSGFKRAYQDVSKELGKEFEGLPNRSGGVRIMPGAIPPLSLEELKEKQPVEIVMYLNNFRSDGSWDGPNESGLFDMVKSITVSDPDLVLDNINEFTNVKYMYAVAILRGLEDNWKQKQDVDWRKAINFCSSYTTTRYFKSYEYDDTSNEYRDTPGAVIQEICDLISLGCRNDKTAFAPELNLAAQQLLSDLSKFVEPIYEIEQESWGYLTLALNSSSGKLLDASILLSLRIARLSPNENRIWNPELRSIYNKYRNALDINALTFEGYYISQLFYLDYNWMLDRLDTNARLANDQKIPFINGLFSANSINKAEISKLIMPFLEWSINNQVEARNHGDNLVALHLAHYIIYAHEPMKSNHIVFRFIETAKVKDFTELLSTLADNHNYPYSDGVPGKIKARILSSIAKVFEAVINRLDTLTEEDKSDVLFTCWRLAKFDKTFGDLSARILFSTAKEVSRDFDFNEFIKYLSISCQNVSKDVTIAEKVISILNEFDLSKAFYIEKEVGLNDLSVCVEYLYLTGLKTEANQFCNDMLEHGKRDFLIPVYKKYNS